MRPVCLSVLFAIAQTDTTTKLEKDDSIFSRAIKVTFRGVWSLCRSRSSYFDLPFPPDK